MRKNTLEGWWQTLKSKRKGKHRHPRYFQTIWDTRFQQAIAAYEEAVQRDDRRADTFYHQWKILGLSIEQLKAAVMVELGPYLDDIYGKLGSYLDGIWKNMMNDDNDGDNPYSEFELESIWIEKKTIHCWPWFWRKRTVYVPVTPSHYNCRCSVLAVISEEKDDE